MTVWVNGLCGAVPRIPIIARLSLEGFNGLGVVRLSPGYETAITG